VMALMTPNLASLEPPVEHLPPPGADSRPGTERRRCLTGPATRPVQCRFPGHVQPLQGGPGSTCNDPGPSPRRAWAPSAHTGRILEAHAPTRPPGPAHRVCSCPESSRMRLRGASSPKQSSKSRAASAAASALRRALRLVDRGLNSVNVQDTSEREPAESGADDRDGRTHGHSFGI